MTSLSCIYPSAQPSLALTLRSQLTTQDKAKSRSGPSSDTNPIGAPPVSDPPAHHPGPDRGDLLPPAPLIPASVPSRDSPSSKSGCAAGRRRVYNYLVLPVPSRVVRGLLDVLPGGASGSVVAGVVSARGRDDIASLRRVCDSAIYRLPCSGVVGRDRSSVFGRRGKDVKSCCCSPGSVMRGGCPCLVPRRGVTQHLACHARSDG